MKKLCIAVPGERDGQGGIVKQMVYLVDQMRTDHPATKPVWLATSCEGNKWPFIYLKSLIRFTFWCAANRGGLVHLNVASHGSFYRKYLLSYIARLFGMYQVIHLHGGGFQAFFDGSHDVVKAMVRGMFVTADAVIILSEGWRPYVKGTLSARDDKIICIPNAVPTPQLRAKADGSGPLHILFAGKLTERKGVDWLIKSLASPDLKEKNWKLTLAGNGDVEHYRSLILRSGLQNKVQCTGWLDNQAMDAHYRDADLFVLPSHIENQPMCILEAMAYGLAIVATDVGSIPNMIHDRENGLLINKDKPESLVAALVEIMENPDLRERLGQQARADHLEDYSMQQYAAKVNQLYHNLLK